MFTHLARVGTLFFCSKVCLNFCKLRKCLKRGKTFQKLQWPCRFFGKKISLLHVLLNTIGVVSELRFSSRTSKTFPFCFLVKFLSLSRTFSAFFSFFHCMRSHQLIYFSSFKLLSGTAV